MSGINLKPALRSLAISAGFASRPHFIIIGAQKAGTSALFSMLGASEAFVSSLMKEIHYFDNDGWYNKKQIDEYHACFPLRYRVSPGNLVFEATPSYLYHPKVAERLHQYDPSLKLVVLLRDPAQRALSAWTMYHHHFRTGPHNYLHDPRSFSEVVATETASAETDIFYTNPKGYISRGIYHRQLRIYLDYFPKEKLCILENKSIMNPNAGGIEKLLHFLGKDGTKVGLVKANESRVENKSSYDAELEKLKLFYKPYNEELFKLIGQRFEW